MRRTLFGLLTITLVGAALASADGRTWTDRTGRQLVAEYIGFSDGKVEIKRTGDGKTFHVPIERFSDADQEFVRSQTEAKETDASTPPPKQDPAIGVGPLRIQRGDRVVVAETAPVMAGDKKVSEFFAGIACTAREVRDNSVKVKTTFMGRKTIEGWIDAKHLTAATPPTASDKERALNLGKADYIWLVPAVKGDWRLWLQKDLKEKGIGSQGEGAFWEGTKDRFVKTGATIPASDVERLLDHSADSGQNPDWNSSGKDAFYRRIHINDASVCPQLIDEITRRFQLKPPLVMTIWIHEGDVHVDLLHFAP